VQGNGRELRHRLLRNGTVCVPEWLLEFDGRQLQRSSRMCDHWLSAGSATP